MLRHLFAYGLFSLFLLALTPAWGGFTLNGSSSLDTFNYDLDNIHLKLEKLNSNWRLSPGADNKLSISLLRAKRMVVTIKENSKKTNSPLPNQIKLPFPLNINQGEIAEVIVITKDEQYSLTDVKFNFDANKKHLNLNLKNAETPWGRTNAAISLATANPFPISGEINLKKLSGDVPYDIAASLSGNLKTLQLESSSLLVLKDNQPSLLQANSNIPKPAAHVSTRIELELENDYPIKLTTIINELQPERLGSYPSAQINVDVTVQGKLLPKLDLLLSFASRDSQWQNQALSSKGELFIQDSTVRDIDIQATLLSNKLSAKGNLNQPNGSLQWQVDLPNLTAFGAGYSGQANANGTVEGSFDNFALHFNLLAEKLQIADILKSDRLEGKAVLMAGKNGELEGELQASKLQYGTYSSVDGSLHVNGSRNSHQITLLAENKESKLESILKGSLNAINDWQGTIQTLSYQGEKPILLQAPAALKVSPDELLLQDASLELGKGELVIGNLSIKPDTFVSTGNFKTLAIEDFPTTLLKLPDQLRSNLILSGAWDINAAEMLNGDINIWREAGDISLNTTDGKSQALGLNEIKVKANFKNNQSIFDVAIQGQHLGDLNAHLATTLTKTNEGYSLLTNAPLKINSSAQLHTLAWLPLPATLPDADIDGQLTMSIRSDGTILKPNLSGMVMGKNLQLTLLSEGVALSDGSLEASFDNDQLFIKQASWKGGQGHLSTSGSLRLENGQPEIKLDWKAEKFTMLSRTDRLLTLSGNGKTTLAKDLLTITGSFTADKGLIQLADESTPKLGDDVIIIGKTEPTPEAALKILLSGLHIDLGKDFIIRGQGIDAELTGAVTLTGVSQYRPHAEGTIQIKKGTYLAYGQTLNIEQGRFSFSGPIDNPGVNIRAMRNSTPVNAGIEITGSAFSPVTKLISEPTVPDSEKLSWLVLGHGTDKADQSQFAMLSLAAGAILSHGQSVPLQTQLARAAGLDEFSFSGGDAENTSLTLGKRLSSQLYLSYQKSITGLLDVARLTFNMTPRWSIRAESGTESAVDVLYTFSFK
jgi:translocation and assembly module TamB